MYAYLADDGYLLQYEDPKLVLAAAHADMVDAASTQDMTDFSEFFWALTADGMREVFAIARAEPDDEVALLIVTANTSFTIKGDEEPDE